MNYTDYNKADWKDITKKLVSKHPIFKDTNYILDKIFHSWNIIWDTKIGNDTINFPLKDIEPRAQIIGEFFETIFSQIILNEHKVIRGSSKEKDIKFLEVELNEFDFEIKTSGQSGGKIFGNRSYAQPDTNGEVESVSRKGKSGFYLCINFFKQHIYNIRIGWIDSTDWEPQKSETGQMAGLKNHVYTDKLISLLDKRLLNVSTEILPKVGPKSTVPSNYKGVIDICDKIKDNISYDELKKFVTNKIQTTYIKEMDKDLRKSINSERFLSLYTLYLQEV